MSRLDSMPGAGKAAACRQSRLAGSKSGIKSYGVASSRPTVRSIALALGLSRATVSNALRGYPGVNAQTRQRVQRAAARLGYVAHPFAAQVMSQLRRSGANKEIGTLAVLEMFEPDRPAGAAQFHAELLAGVRKRAGALGFASTHWMFGPGSDLSLKRLDQILHNRGIAGLVLLPTWSEPDFRALDWSRFTGIYVDYLIHRPALHTVCCDHGLTMFNALEKARERGYRRPGIAVAHRTNARVHGRWVGAYLAYLSAHPELTPVPPLVVDEADELNPVNFLPWFRQQRPDVVLTHWIGALDQMTAAGAEVPRSHGFICLNLQVAPAQFSGFSQQPRKIGERAAELVIAQLAHGEAGPPSLPSTTMLPSRWKEGATIRAPG